MGKKMKIWLIIAASLVVIGCIIFGGAMAMFKWDFTKLSTVKYDINDYEINEDYKNISISTKTADISFEPSGNLKTSVICHEQKNVKHLVSVQDGALVIEIVDTRKWYEHIGINFGTPKITVYIPQGEYGTLSVNASTGDVEIPEEFKFESMDVLVSTGNVTNYASASETIKIKTSTGKICVENVSAKTLDLSVSTGKTNLTEIKCDSVISSGNTGDISMKNVVAAEKISIKRSTGDVRFEGSDAAEIIVETDTGNVAGSLLTDKVFVTETSTGRISVPKTTSGGKCEITTSTGDIEIDIK